MFIRLRTRALAAEFKQTFDNVEMGPYKRKLEVKWADREFNLPAPSIRHANPLELGRPRYEAQVWSMPHYDE